MNKSHDVAFKKKYKYKEKVKAQLKLTQQGKETRLSSDKLKEKSEHDRRTETNLKKKCIGHQH